MNVFYKLASLFLSLVSCGGVAKHEFMYSSVCCLQFLGKRYFFVNWPPPHTHEHESLVKYGFPAQIWTFHFILIKKCFAKDPPTLLSPLRDEGLEIITFLNKSGHIMQFLTVFFFFCC